MTEQNAVYDRIAPTTMAVKRVLMERGSVRVSDLYDMVRNGLPPEDWKHECVRLRSTLKHLSERGMIVRTRPAGMTYGSDQDILTPSARLLTDMQTNTPTREWLSENTPEQSMKGTDQYYFRFLTKEGKTELDEAVLGAVGRYDRIPLRVITTRVREAIPEVTPSKVKYSLKRLLASGALVRSDGSNLYSREAVA